MIPEQYGFFLLNHSTTQAIESVRNIASYPTRKLLEDEIGQTNFLTRIFLFTTNIGFFKKTYVVLSMATCYKFLVRIIN